MGQQLNYSQALRNFLEDYAQIRPAGWEQVQNQVVIDRENHHYQLVRVGWLNGQHIHYAVFHFDLIDDKVWVQENRTDLPILDELEAVGIPRKDVLLAFQEPQLV